LVVAAFASRLLVGLDPSRIADEWFAEERTEIIAKLTEARRTLVGAPIEEKRAAGGGAGALGLRPRPSDSWQEVPEEMVLISA
jgi:hypothetical protein